MAQAGHPGTGRFQEAARGHTCRYHAQISEHEGPRGPHMQPHTCTTKTKKPTDTGEKTRKGTHQSGDNPWSRARGRAPPSAMASVHGLLGHETPEGCAFGGVGRGGWSSESLCSSRVCDPVLCLTQIRLTLYTRYCFITFKESTLLYVIPLEQHNEPVSRADKAPGYR